ncbi:GerMN domain-containing protein [Virgibacillus siamensis]|uniref:GerMN domain-containing protein n=1 Tax=Virgibacillus siamensis TaxID=480071 RepID=UPI000984C214|nr:GerMN domain-containing protein [Virgibacillus siamensis]
MKKRRIMLPIIPVSLAIILTGCFQGEQSLNNKNEEIDPPKENAEAVNDLEKAGKGEEKAVSKSDDKTSETVSRQLYLIDSNGMVASQTLELPVPESKEVAAQALEYLVKGGPVTQLLPNGFQGVLPQGTKVLGMNLKKNGTLVVNVSKDFKNYKKKNEAKILQAMTFTLTQFDNVKNIKLEINGKMQNAMPVNGTPIGNGYSRANGINLVQSDTVDLMESKPVTLFFPSVQGENQYFVPVTKYVNVSEGDVYSSIVQELVEGPGVSTNLQHVFNEQAELVSSPSINDGVLELEFSQGVLKNSDKAVIPDKVMETLVRTLTADESVEAVEVKVKDVKTLFNEEGKPYTKPVTTQMFVPTEKL